MICVVLLICGDGGTLFPVMRQGSYECSGVKRTNSSSQSSKYMQSIHVITWSSIAHSRQWPTHAITRWDLRSAGEFIMPPRRLTRRQFDGDDNANGNNKFSFQGLAGSVSQMSPLSCRWAGEAALRWRSGQAAGGRRQPRWDY